jgi:hypothetical protein
LWRIATNLDFLQAFSRLAAAIRPEDCRSKPAD